MRLLSFAYIMSLSGGAVKQSLALVVKESMRHGRQFTGFGT
jgi:hypothetical protein